MAVHVIPVLPGLLILLMELFLAVLSYSKRKPLAVIVASCVALGEKVPVYTRSFKQKLGTPVTQAVLMEAGTEVIAPRVVPKEVMVLPLPALITLMFAEEGHPE